MSGYTLLLNLAGAIALLLWATRMVRTGIQRGYSSELRRVIRKSSSSLFLSATCGAMSALLLQSATAVAILISGFSKKGYITPTLGLALLLGADVGSAVAARILSLDLTLIIPVLLIIGTATFLKSDDRTFKQIGRVVVGIALILISLGMISNATSPLRNSELLPVVINYLSTDIITTMIVAAIFTWLLHSSVASVLLIAALAANGVIESSFAAILILGANLGAGLIAVGVTRDSEPPERAIVYGNLLARGLFAIAIVSLFNNDILAFFLLGASPTAQVVNFHVIVNLALAIIFLPLSPLIIKLTLAIANLNTGKKDQEEIVHDVTTALDRTVIHTPRLALASATREILRMSETIDTMLRRVIDLYDSSDKAEQRALARLDDSVDSSHMEIKHYLAEITRDALTDEESVRCLELTEACIKLEHVGDIITKNLIPHAAKIQNKNLKFSDQGWIELTELHGHVVVNAQLALNVLISGDLATARQLVTEQDQMRLMEIRNNRRHIERLTAGTINSIETSEIHLDTIRDLRQISSLFASFAYPILEQNGELLSSRLIK